MPATGNLYHSALYETLVATYNKEDNAELVSPSTEIGDLKLILGLGDLEL